MGASGGARIVISGTSVLDDAAVGDAIGTLSVIGGSGVYTFTEIADPDALFAIDVDAVEVAAALTVGSYSYTVQADNGVDDPIQRVFTFTVTSSAPSTAGEPIGLLLILTKAA